MSIYSPKRLDAKIPPPRGPKRLARSRYTCGAPGPVRRELGADLIGMFDDLCRPPRFTGALFLLGDIAMIAATAAIGFLAATPFLTVLAVLYIGIRQRYLSNLAHECAHLKLVRSKVGNRLLGHVMAILLVQSFVDYQDEHREHHALLGTGADPKLAAYAARGATTPRRDKWEFILHVFIANSIWTLPAYTVRGWFTKRRAESWSIFTVRVIFWALALAFAAWEHAELVVLWYWVVPLIVVRPAVHWLTDVGNHAGLTDDSDLTRQTRGWTSHVLTRHVLGGHLDDMYHPIHHWAPRIPFRMLPRAMRIVQDGYPRANEIIWCSGFFFRRRRTPDVPSVIEDIVARLRPMAPFGSEN
jgi:fatty acid desaturase